MLLQGKINNRLLQAPGGIKRVTLHPDWLGGKCPELLPLLNQEPAGDLNHLQLAMRENQHKQLVQSHLSRLVSSRLVLSYLHCPLSVSQLTSGVTMPGREQLQTSQPTTGWHPNVWGSHWVHSGRIVLGGQIQSPVTGSHNLVPQLQAGGKRR